MIYDILIPHFGRGRLTELCLACLRSIREHSKDYRLIFVDNGSPEFGAVEPELRLHEHLLIRNTKNLGFVGAINQGLWMSVAPYVVLLNNDTEAVPGWLDQLREPLEAGAAGLSGPRTTTPNSWQGRAPAGEGYRILGTHQMLAFFCVMMTREVIDGVGQQEGEYAQFGGFGGDDSYCRKAHKAGYRLALVQDLVIPHHHRSTFGELYSGEQIQALQHGAMRRFKATCP